MRDAPVHVLRAEQQYLVSAYDGSWRNHAGSQRGRDLVSLAALRWSCPYGQAAHRVARLIGLDGVPALKTDAGRG
ncbi:hypothetical protein [Falsiroseomonas sp. HW251]|uniref:hypothetical protein n=1 Tax=Falsiroseomonas sp. HW251 TaxID=3390998 RepID=UPI003D310C7E